MKKTIKVLLFTILSCILIFVTTNPSVRRFKEYVGTPIPPTRYEIKRTSNYILYSVYECNGDRYIGYLMNFHKKESIKITEPPTIYFKPTLDSGIIDPEVISRNSVYRAKDGKIVTWNQLENSGYTYDRINRGVYNGVLTPLPYDSIKGNSKLTVWLMLDRGSAKYQPYESFQQDYSNTERVNSLYYGLKQDGLYSKTINDFYNQYFPELK